MDASYDEELLAHCVRRLCTCLMHQLGKLFTQYYSHVASVKNKRKTVYHSQENITMSIVCNYVTKNEC